MIKLYNSNHELIEEIYAFEYNIQNSGMGDEIITFQLKRTEQEIVDFNIEWYVIYNDKKLYLQSYSPAAYKSNDSFSYIYTLVFNTNASKLKHRYMFNFVDEEDLGRKVNDDTFQFNGDIKQFVDRIRLNLLYHFGEEWIISISNDSSTLDSVVTVSISKATIWDVLTMVWDLYGIRFKIIYDGDKNEIVVGEDAAEVETIFEYGDGNGLYKVDRANSNDEIVTRLRGRGGSRNLPVRYYKSLLQIGDTVWTGDPDEAEELSLTHYTNLMPSMYRLYVQGWNAAKQGVPLMSGDDYYYRVGHGDYTSGKNINPIDYVDSENIDKWGVRDGTLDNNEEIYPTLQNTILNGIRVDTIIDVEQVVSDDWQIVDNDPVVIENISTPSKTWGKNETDTTHFISDYFFVGYNSKFTASVGLKKRNRNSYVDSFGYSWADIGVNETIEVRLWQGTGIIQRKVITGLVFGETVDVEFTDIAAGEYRLQITDRVECTNNRRLTDRYTQSVTLSDIKFSPDSGFKQTFDVWIPDVGFDLRNTDYWTNEDMTFMFSDGLLAGEDYEFRVIGEVDSNGKMVNPYIYEDNSRSHDGITSKYRVTLEKSTSELEASGRYLPNININAKAGDHFFIINIQMPHIYVELAEEKLTNSLREQLSLLDDEYPTYSMYFSRLFYENLPESEKKKLETGNAKLRLRDETLIGGAYEVLYIQNLSMKYNGNFIPDITITISDKVLPSQSTLQLIQGEVRSLSYVGGGGTGNIKDFEKYFLRKDGIIDTSYSQTTFTQPITYYSGWQTEDFRQAEWAGSGAGLYKDEYQNSCLEVDKLFVRRSLFVNELVVNQITSVGGKLVISPANMVVSNVDEGDDYWRIYFDTEDATIDNHWQLDDQAYCQRFNPESTEVVKYYWALVVGLGTDYIDISKTDRDGEGIPTVGDNVAMIGNRTETGRQSAFIIDTLNGGDIVLYAGINSYNFVNKNYVGYGTRPSTGDPYFYTYGDAFFGDRNLEKNYITFQKRAGDTDRQLYINAVVTFGDGSGGLSNLSEWKDFLGDFDKTIDELEKANKEALDKLELWADDDYISPLEKEPLWNAWLAIDTQYNDFIAKVDIYEHSYYDDFVRKHAAAYTAAVKYTNSSPENIPIESDYENISILVREMNEFYPDLEQTIKDNAGNKNWGTGMRPENPKIGDTWTSQDDQYNETVYIYTSAGWVTYADNTKTVIDKGLITTGTLAVGQGSLSTQGLAGITGAGNDDNSIRVWAGNVDRERAPFRVTQDGTMYASQAIIEGIIRATSGYIAGFEIHNNALGVTESDANNGMRLQDGYIRFSHLQTQKFIYIGVDSVVGSGVVFANNGNPSNETNIAINAIAYNGTYNIALNGNGSIVTDGLVSSRVVNTIGVSRRYNIDLSVSNVLLYDPMNAGSGVVLPTVNNLFGNLGIAGTRQNASVKLTIIGSYFSDFEGYIHGRNTDDDLTSSEYPEIIGNNGQLITSPLAISKGDIVEFQLIYSENNYQAYIVNHRY